MPFTPVHSVLGGLCIGLSTYYNARLHARVTGISGTLFRAASSAPAALFLSGLALSGALLRPISAPLQSAPLALVGLGKLVLAGALVGAGARLANGCTSGHAVCGVARLRPRSLVATAVFMLCGALVATGTHLTDIYKLAPASRAVVLPTLAELPALVALVAASAAVPPLLGALAARAGKAGRAVRAAVHVALGAAFGAGLLVSGMASPAKTAAFLAGGPAWEPSLPFVFVGALPLAAVGLRDVPAVNVGITRRLLVGAALFGAGWGSLGICPGPAVVYAGAWPGWEIAAFGISVLAAGSAAPVFADLFGL